MAPSSLGPGAFLGGRYQLDDLLSETRGARFWRGTDTVLGRSVAVNALPSDDSRASGLLAAARASATVTESHLLRVLDCSVEEEFTWVVNEWGHGTSLDIMLERGPLPPVRAAWLAREVAETIVAAHAAGVAHGRLTPESVLVTEAGTVKLIGFVVTAAIEGAASDEPGLAARGYGHLDPLEADVINLAGILYAAVTGRWPGVSPSAVPTAPYDQRGPLRPRQVRAGVPRMLDAICGRVLRKEAHGHVLPIETAHEILAALDDEVGDPLTNAPTDVHGMYVEPTVAIHPDELPEHARVSGLSRHGDPEATQASPPPTWTTDASLPKVHEEPDQLPPYVELPDRPLFASTERRQPLPASASLAEPGSAAWLFGDDGVDPFEQPPQPQRRRWWRTVALAVVVIAVLVATVLAFDLGRDNTIGSSANPSAGATSTTPGSGTHVPITPVSVHDFDPEGRPPSENPGEVGLAVDGKPATGWQTSTYKGSAALGGLKSGVGLLFDLGMDRHLSSIEVHFTGTPTSFSVYLSPAGVSEPPTDLAGMTRLGTLRAQQPDATLRPTTSAQGRFVVLWLTELPKVARGFRGQVDQVTLRS